jgi:LysR family transcriptional regulator, benzoate and cis,cis-muconate-responsive activator of ben and cat genes
LEIKQLRYFIAVAEELNFTRAAHRIGIAQPPLSQQILSLEHQLRAQLFVRSKRKVELTPAGEVLLSHARRVINAANDAVDAVRAASNGGTGRVRLGAMYSVINSFVPAILRECARAEPNLQIDVRELTVAQQQQGLNDSSIDLAVVRGKVDGAHLTQEFLFEEPFIAAIPDELVPGDGAVQPDWLARQRFVSMARSSNIDYTELLRRFGGPLGGDLQIVQEASDMPTLLSLVVAGIGCAIVPASIISSRLAGITYRPIVGTTPKTSVSLAWRSDNDLPALPRVIGYITEIAAKHDVPRNGGLAY